MLGKLIKYEFKSTIRTFLGIYISMLVTGLLIGIFNVANIEQGTALGIVVFFGLLVALFVLTITIIIKRFKDNLFGDEGYLMFTLPVSAKNIVISKLVVSVVYIIISVLIVIATFTVMVIPSVNEINNLIQMGNEFKTSLIANLVTERELILNIIYMFIVSIIGYIEFVLTIYLSLSIGQLKPFQNHRKLFSIVSFFVINLIVSTIGNNINKILGTISISANAEILITILLTCICSLILFMITSYILEKKLNLE